MAYALVKQGTVAQSTTTVTPTFGQATTAGNLLVCWAVGGSSSLAISAGWSTAQINPSSTGRDAGIFYKIAAGSDAAPTVSVASGTIRAQLAEFSGNAATSPLDKTGTGNGTAASLAITATAADATPGELVLFAVDALYSATSASNTLAGALNNGATVTDAYNGTFAAVTSAEAEFGYGITTGNGAANVATITVNTGAVRNGESGAIASFRLAAGAGGGAPAARSLMCMGVGS